MLSVCLALAAAGFAFIGGQVAADPHGRYEAGVREGEKVGRGQVAAAYAPGSDGYRAIFERGRRSGERAGRRAGRREAARAGRVAGRNQAFADFRGGWRIGRWYLVNIRPGDKGARYDIGGRVTVRSDEWYGVCRGVLICRRSR